MAHRNYVKLTHGGDTLIVGFYKPCGEMVDVLDCTLGYITTEIHNRIDRWIFDGVSPTEDEDVEALQRSEREAYGKPYNR